MLLQKQYRPPIDKVAIEVPAGLIDEGESVEECAVRELKEETGFVGIAEQTSAIMFNGLLSLLLLPSLTVSGLVGGLRYGRSRVLQYQSEYGPCPRGYVVAREPESETAAGG